MGKLKKILINEYVSFFMNIALEMFEFSIGLFILSKINNMTNQNVDILQSLDFLITSLVYLVVSIKSLSVFLEPNIKSKVGNYVYNFYTVYSILGIVFITLDIINFKSGRAVDFNFIYKLIFIGIIAKVLEKTLQNTKLKFLIESQEKGEELIELRKQFIELHEELEGEHKDLRRSYEKLQESHKKLQESVKN